MHNLDSMPVSELSVLCGTILLETSGPSDQLWSSVVKETIRRGCVCCQSAHSLRRSRLSAFMHSETVSFFWQCQRVYQQNILQSGARSLQEKESGGYLAPWLPVRFAVCFHRFVKHSWSKLVEQQECLAGVTFCVKAQPHTPAPVVHLMQLMCQVASLFI